MPHPSKKSFRKNFLLALAATTLAVLFLFSTATSVEGEESQEPFIMRVEANADNKFTIPTSGSGYNYDIYWEKIDDPTTNGTLENQDGDSTIEFPESDEYLIEITGSFPRIFFDNSGDKDYVLDIKQWGDIEWSSFARAFWGCSNMMVTATDTPDLSNVTDLTEMFRGCSVADPDVSNWDVSNITDMGGRIYRSNSWNWMGMFNGATNANPDVSNWNTENLENTRSMFLAANNANPDISNWNIESLENASDMFNSSAWSDENYGKALVSFSNQSVQSGVSFGAGDARPLLGEPANAKETLENDYGWSFSDGGNVYAINSLEELAAIANQSSNYMLIRDLDFNDPNSYDDPATNKPLWTEGEGWEPISGFSGSLLGDGYKIKNLFINRPETDNVGLFSSLGSAKEVANLKLINPNITGATRVGSLVGSTGYHPHIHHIILRNGNISGENRVGGISGFSRMRWSYGGHFSEIAVYNSNIHASNSMTTGGVGAIAGHLGEQITNWQMGRIYRSYVDNQTTVTSGGRWRTAGLVATPDYPGVTWHSLYVEDCISLASVEGERVKGITAKTGGSGSVIRSLFAGELSGSEIQKGITEDGNNIIDSFWDTETSGTTESDGGIGLTTEQAQSFETYDDAGWDIVTVNPGEINNAATWNIVDGESYPFLSWTKESLIPLPAPTLVVDTNEIQVSWPSVEDINEYEVWYNNSSDFATATLLEVTESPEYTITGLSPDTSYWVWYRPLRETFINPSPVSSVIYTVEALDSIREDLFGSYILMRNLDFEDPESYADSANMSTYTEGEGWQPIGNMTPFAGIFSGPSRIENLYINRPESDRIGLFGHVTGSIERVTTSGSVIGRNKVGGIIGFADSATLNNISSLCDVKGELDVGGLIGLYDSASADKTFSAGLVDSEAVPSLKFSGSDGEGVMVGELFNNTASNVTVSAWFKAKFLDDDRFILSETVNGSSTSGIRLHFTSNNLTLGWAGSTESFDGTSYLDEEWHFVTVVIDNGSVDFWVDNTLVHSGSVGSGQPNFDDNMIIGDHEHLDRSWTGFISDVRVYSTSLSDSEIGQLYEERFREDVAPNDLIGHWKLNDGYGDTAQDSSGERHGTLENKKDLTWVTRGGIIGSVTSDESTVENSYWDTEISNQSTSAGGEGKTTAEMQQIATFSEWDIVAVAPDIVNDSYTWNIVDGESYPFLSHPGHLSPPEPPTLDPDSNQIHVSWSTVEDADEYEVWYNNSDDSDNATKHGKTSELEYTITGLNSGTDYWVWLKAISHDPEYKTGFSDASTTKTLYLVTFQDHDETVISTEEVQHGNLVPEPAEPTRSGYTFDDWYANEALTTPWNFDTDTITENTTIYAGWDINQYELIYTAGINGTVIGDSPQLVDYNENGTQVTAVPDEGYYFVEWNDGIKEAERTDENVSDDVNAVALFSKIPEISNIDVTADKTTAEITWNSNVDMSTQLKYGRSSSLIRETTEKNTDPRIKTHSVLLEDLPPCAKHFYRTVSDDGNDVAEYSKIESETFSFFTKCEVSDVAEEEPVSVEEVSKETGGTVVWEKNDSSVTLEFPAGYSENDTIVQLIKLIDEGLPSAVDDSELIPGKVMRLLAFNDINNEELENFDEEVEFIIKYPQAITEIFMEETLDAYKFDEETKNWNKLDCELNTGERTLTCLLSSFSTYGVMGQKNPESSSGGGGIGLWPPEEEEEEEKEKPQPPQFTDIKDHWGEDYINTLATKCDVHGYADEDGDLLNLFGPNNSMTRAEMTKMVAGCLEKEIEATYQTSTPPFPDVEVEKWFTPYINYAKENGLIDGYPDGTFRPTENINRVEALKVILLSIHTEEEISKFSQEIPQTDLPTFQDTTPNAWYSHYLNFAASKAIISGYADSQGVPTGYFGPADNLTRSQAAKIIMEVLEL